MKNIYLSHQNPFLLNPQLKILRPKDLLFRCFQMNRNVIHCLLYVKPFDYLQLKVSPHDYGLAMRVLNENMIKGKESVIKSDPQRVNLPRPIEDWSKSAASLNQGIILFCTT